MGSLCPMKLVLISIGLTLLSLVLFGIGSIFFAIQIYLFFEAYLHLTTLPVFGYIPAVLGVLFFILAVMVLIYLKKHNNFVISWVIFISVAVFYILLNTIALSTPTFDWFSLNLSGSRVCAFAENDKHTTLSPVTENWCQQLRQLFPNHTY